MHNQTLAAPVEYVDNMGDAQATPIDLLALLATMLRHWKLIFVSTLFSLAAAYGVLKIVPSAYKSTVEILVYDPQRQIDAAVQKPISPFVDDVGLEAMNTEIDVLKSKSVALRVAAELGLDQDPEFEGRGGLAALIRFPSFRGLGQTFNDRTQPIGTDEDRAERLDRAADALIQKMQVWQESYILFVSATSHSPIKAQRLAATIAKDYLAGQREARQEALQRVAGWLKGRVENLQSRVLETESEIEKLKADSNIDDAESSNLREQQITELNKQIMTARADVDEKSARLQQARHVIDTNGDVEGIQELTSSTTLTALRQKQAELNLRAIDLQNKLGGQHIKVVATRTELAGINKQIADEAEHILGNMKNAYDIAVRTGAIAGREPAEPDRTFQLRNIPQVAAAPAHCGC